MNKRCAFYTFFQDSPTEETLLHQGCIKSCIKKKQGPMENPSPNKGSLFDVFRKETLCQLPLYRVYSSKTEKLP